MPLFEKKSPVVEAIQFTGTNREEIVRFVNGERFHVYSYMESLFLEEGTDKDAVQYTSTIKKGDWVVKAEDNTFTVLSEETLRKNYQEK